MTTPQLSPTSSSSPSATPLLSSSPSFSAQPSLLSTKRNTSDTTIESPASTNPSPNLNHSEIQAPHKLIHSPEDQRSHVASNPLTWSPFSKLAAVVRAIFAWDGNSTRGLSSPPSVLSMYEKSLTNEHRQSGLGSVDNEYTHESKPSLKRDMEDRPEKTKPLGKQKLSDRSVVIDQLRIRPYISPYASYINAYGANENYGHNDAYGPYPHSHYQAPSWPDTYGVSSFLRMARNFAANRGAFDDQPGNAYSSTNSHMGQSYGSANAERSDAGSQFANGVPNGMNAPYYEQGSYASAENSYTSHNARTHRDAPGESEGIRASYGKREGAPPVFDGQMQEGSPSEVFLRGSAPTVEHVESGINNLGNDGVRTASIGGIKETSSNEYSNSAHSISAGDVGGAQNPSVNHVDIPIQSSDGSVAQGHDSNHASNSEDNTVEGDRDNERAEKYVSGDSQGQSGDGADPENGSRKMDPARGGSHTEYTPPSRLPYEPKEDNSENTEGNNNDSNEKSGDGEYDNERPALITSRVEVTPVGLAFRGVPGGIKNGENITQLSLMVYKVARAEHVTSMAAVPCYEVKDWIPSVVQRLESEIIGFEFHCVDVMDNDEDVDGNRARLQELKEFYGDISGLFIQTTADDVSLHLPNELDMVVSWMGLQKWGMRKGWRFLKGLRRTKAKRLLLSNDSVRNNIQGEQGLLNVRKSPMLFNEPSRVISKVTEDNTRQLLLYEMDKIRDKF